MVSEFRSPLGCHVASSVDSGKGEHSVVTGLYPTTDLRSNEVLLPVLSDGPVLILDPSLGSVGADRHIGITRVLQDLVLILKGSVDLNRATGVLDVIGVDVLIAEVPGLNTLWDVELSSNGGVVQICEGGLSIGAGWNQLEVRVRRSEERSVFSSLEVVL